MEIYFANQIGFDPSDVTFEGPYDEVARLEAERLFKWYQQEHSFDEFGKVEVEKTLKGSFDNIPYTTRLDLLVPNLTKQRIARSPRLSQLDLQPGPYILDHKTESRDGFEDRLVNSRQFVGQQLLYEQVTGTQARGVLVNVVVKVKAPWQRLLFIPPPERADRLAFKTRLERATKILREEPYWTNDRACFGYFSPCQHWLEGRCDRSPLTTKRLQERLKVL